MMELQETQTTRYMIENAQKIIKKDMAISMFGKDLISFLSLYLSINIEWDLHRIEHCVTVIEGLWLLLLFAAAFIRFSCYCQKYLKGHAIYHWFLYPLSSVFSVIYHVHNIFGWSKKAFQIPKNLRTTKFQYFGSSLSDLLYLILRKYFHFG